MATATLKPFYNVIVSTPEGDKILIAQTTTPDEFIDMEYPSAAVVDETDDGEKTWTIYREAVEYIVIEAIPVRPVRLNVLLAETDYNKIRRM